MPPRDAAHEMTLIACAAHHLNRPQHTPGDVAGVNRRRLVSYFASLPTVLDKDSGLAVFDAARDCRTWLGADA